MKEWREIDFKSSKWVLTMDKTKNSLKKVKFWVEITQLEY